jgi:hypothetical protein
MSSPSVRTVGRKEKGAAPISDESRARFLATCVNQKQWFLKEKE